MKKTAALPMKAVKRELTEVARIGQAFLDGDLFRRVLFPHAERFLCGDDMDFDPAAFLPLKKTLLRMERIARVPCSTALWRRRPDFPGCGEALVYGFFGSPLGGPKPPRGYRPPRMFPELASALLRGRPAWKLTPSAGARHMAERGAGLRVKGIRRPTFIQLFAPFRDSLGETAGALEVFAADPGDEALPVKYEFWE